MSDYADYESMFMDDESSAEGEGGAGLSQRAGSQLSAERRRKIEEQMELRRIERSIDLM